MSELRPYQVDAIEALRDSIRGGVKRIVLQAPTGAGKTLLASTIGNGAARHRNGCWCSATSTSPRSTSCSSRKTPSRRSSTPHDRRQRVEGSSRVSV